MEIKIVEKQYVEKIVNVDFPYYYKIEDSNSDTHVTYYGKVNQHSSVVICVTDYYNGKLEYEISINKHRIDSYYDEQYRSSKEEFDNVISTALEIINSI